MRLRQSFLILWATLLVMIAGVRPAYAEPDADAGQNQEVPEGSFVTLDGSGSRPDDDDDDDDDDNGELTFAWDQLNGPTVVLNGADTPRPTFTAPDVENDFTFRFRLTVSDGQGESDSDNVNVRILNVEAANGAPVASAGADQEAAPGTVVTLNGTGSRDPDGDPLTFSWSQTAGPPVALSNPNAATPSFTAPPVAGPTTFEFELSVTDGRGGAGADRTIVTVAPAAVDNRPPAAVIRPIGPTPSGSTVQLDGSGSSDPDGEALTYQWTQTGGPPVPVNGPDQPVAAIVAPATSLVPVTMSFRLTVADPRGGTGAADVSFLVVPGNGNRPPVAVAGADRQVRSGVVVEMSGAASSDPDGDPLAFSWSQVEGPLVELSDPASAVTRFTAPPTDSQVDLIFRLIVSDGRGGDAFDDIAVRVLTSTSSAPSAHAGEDRAVVGGGPVTLDGTGSTDPSGSALAFEWRQIGGPVVVIENAAAPVTTFQAPAVPTETELRFQLTVTGPGGQSVDTVSITLLPPSAPQPQEPQFSASISALSIFPNPVDPGEGPATFEYELGADSDVTITIYDMFGRLVRELLAPRGGDGGLRGVSRWRWDGRNGEGNEVGNGGYVVEVRAVDSNGGSARATGRLAVVR